MKAAYDVGVNFFDCAEVRIAYNLPAEADNS